MRRATITERYPSRDVIWTAAGELRCRFRCADAWCPGHELDDQYACFERRARRFTVAAAAMVLLSVLVVVNATTPSLTAGVLLALATTVVAALDQVRRHA